MTKYISSTVRKTTEQKGRECSIWRLILEHIEMDDEKKSNVFYQCSQDRQFSHFVTIPFLMLSPGCSESNQLNCTKAQELTQTPHQGLGCTQSPMKWAAKTSLCTPQRADAPGRKCDPKGGGILKWQVSWPLLKSFKYRALQSKSSTTISFIWRTYKTFLKQLNLDISIQAMPLFFFFF